MIRIAKRHLIQGYVWTVVDLIGNPIDTPSWNRLHAYLKQLNESE